MDRTDEPATVVTPDWLARSLPLSGIAAVALQIVAYPLTGSFDYRPAPERAVEIIDSNSSGIALAALLGGFYSILFLLVFAGAVASAILGVDRHGPLAFVALAGGVVVALAIALGYRFLAAAAHVAAGPVAIGPEAAALMHRLFQMSFAGLVSIGLAAWIGATGIAAIRTGLLPDWLGWASVVIAAGLMTPLHGPLEGIALVWIVVVSVVLYRRGPLGHHLHVGPGQRLEPRSGAAR
jgi:hypothetical protein